jgi:sulfur carrier protein ThiS
MEPVRMSRPLESAGDHEAIAVTVTLFADLKRFAPPGIDGPHRRTVAAGATVADLLAAMGIPPDYDLTVGLDGELASREDALHDGAEVMLLSPMEGG